MTRFTHALTTLFAMVGCLGCRHDAGGVFDPESVAAYHIELPVGGAEALEANYQPTGCDEHVWTRASVTYDDPRTGESETFDDVGVRLQGHNTFVDDGTERPGYKLSFDEFVDDQDFHGLHHVNLIGSGGDDTGMRERLALELLDAMGVPVEREAHAAVYVDGTFAGIYANREEPDDQAFLDAHFAASGGTLYKVKGYCGPRATLTTLGDDPGAYTATYEPKAGTEPADMTRDLIPLLQCASAADDADLQACIPTWIDVHEWLAEMAVDMALPDVDGMASAGQNFLLYTPPGARTVVYSWDKDLAFNLGAMNDPTGDIFSLHPAWLGDSQPELGLRLRRVYSAEFCTKVLQVAAMMTQDAIGARISGIHDVMEPWVKRDPFRDVKTWEAAVAALRADIETRRQAVVEQATRCSAVGE
jgi:spore coat protein CotH